METTNCGGWTFPAGAGMDWICDDCARETHFPVDVDCEHLDTVADDEPVLCCKCGRQAPREVRT